MSSNNNSTLEEEEMMAEYYTQVAEYYPSTTLHQPTRVYTMLPYRQCVVNTDQGSFLCSSAAQGEYINSLYRVLFSVQQINITFALIECYQAQQYLTELSQYLKNIETR
jgi:hypothetical protein